MAAPQIGKIHRDNGVAGQVSYTTEVTYPDEPTRTIQFVGSVYGGPVVMVTANGQQDLVADPGRFGEFGPDWVRRFFGDTD